MSNFCNDFVKCLLILKIRPQLDTAMNYLQNKYNISRQLLKTLLHYHVKDKSFFKLHLLYQFLTTKLCQTFITSWIVNRFEKHIPRIWNITTLLQWLLTRLAYCQRSKCPQAHLTRKQARRRALVNCAINCTLLNAVPNVQHFLNFANLWLVHALLDKAVNKSVK